MPVSRFFLMLSEGRKQRYREYSELAAVQAISICKAEYYEKLRDRYKMMYEDEPPKLPEKPYDPRFSRPVFNAATEEGHNALISIFSAAKGRA